MSLPTAAPSSPSMAEARSHFYGFLSRLLLEAPSEVLLSPLRQPDFLADLKVVFGETLASYFQEFTQKFPDDLNPLVQEYHDLFTVPLGQYVAPYEAVYRNEREMDGKRVRGLLIGESTLAVLRSYQQAGLTVSESFLDLPDHAGLELSFMGYLCSKQAEALNRGEDEESFQSLCLQKAFLLEHLSPWIPRLCARIAENAQGPFYKGVARLVEAFLSWEAKTLSHSTPSE